MDLKSVFTLENVHKVFLVYVSKERDTVLFTWILAATGKDLRGMYIGVMKIFTLKNMS